MVRQAETYEVAASIAGNGNSECSREKRQASGKPDTSRNDRANGGFHARKSHSTPQNNGSSSNGDRRDHKARNIDPKRKSNKFNLSKQEMSDLRAAKKCFLCKEAGHVARQCPRVNSVTSTSGARRPPGVRSNNVEISFEDAEDLRASIEEDNTLHTIEIGMMDMSGHFTDTAPLIEPVDNETGDESMDYDTDPDMPGLIPVDDDDDSDEEGEESVPIPEDIERAAWEALRQYYGDHDDDDGFGFGFGTSGADGSGSDQDQDHQNEQTTAAPGNIVETPDDEDDSGLSDFQTCSEGSETEEEAHVDPQSMYVMNWGLFASEMLAEVRVIDDYVHIPVEQATTADPFEDADGELVIAPEVDIKEWANLSPNQWNERTHWEWYSAYYFPGGCMGDSAANAQTMYMETVKEFGFPGDEKFAPVSKWEPRFTFWSISSRDYALKDNLRRGEIVLVNKELLQDEEFNLAWWYAKYLADLNGIDHSERCVALMEWQPFVVDALDENLFTRLGAMEIRAALTEGREIFMKDNGRWWLDFDDAREWCTIGDRLLKLESKVKVSLLENASFNLEDWYNKKVLQAYRDVESAVHGNDGTADLRVLYNPDEGGDERALDSLALMMTTSARDRMRVSSLDVDEGRVESAESFARRMASKPFVLHGPRRDATMHSEHRAEPPTTDTSKEKLAIRIPRLDKRGGSGGGKVAKAPAQGSAEFLNKDVSGSKPVPAEQGSSAAQAGDVPEDASLVGVLTSRHDGIDLKKLLE
ncbi:hypothetical protein EYR40_004613 [Pleurotus pulmonarius]|nr:hypothetical protein EYR40_004613 [Pleurotus pulmonarius]